jgi:phosphoglycolate phosphatase
MSEAVLLDNDGVVVEPPATETVVAAAREVLDWGDIDADPRTVARELRAGEVAALARRCRRAGVSLARFCRRAASASFDRQHAAIEAGERAVYDDAGTLTDLEPPVGLVSDNQPHVVALLLRRAGLREAVATVRCRSLTPQDLRRTKPDPANIEAALADLGATAGVFVGDRAADVLAAHEAGLRSVHLARDGVDEPAGVDPDHTIRSLAELPALL